MKQTINLLGYSLTPPALFINIGEWFQQLTINQVFTIVISSLVVLFWTFNFLTSAFKARKEYIESQIEKKKLEKMG